MQWWPLWQWIRSLRSHEMSNDTKCKMTQNVKWHKMSNDTKCQMTRNVKWYRMSNDKKLKIKRNDTNVNVDLWLQAETTGVTHFGAYNRPPDDHFFQTWGGGSKEIWNFSENSSVWLQNLNSFTQSKTVTPNLTRPKIGAEIATVLALKLNKTNTNYTFENICWPPYQTRQH